MLLSARLDQARVRRVASDPVAIAEIVGRRTSLPLDAILAMLTNAPRDGRWEGGHCPGWILRLPHIQPASVATEGNGSAQHLRLARS